jgi:broad specificity phosphatase PhoE
MGACLGDLIADSSGVTLVASPLGRAAATARIVAEAIGIPVERCRFEPRLMEVAVGDWEGLDHGEIERREPDLVRRHPHHGWYLHAPGGERYAAALDRAGTWLRSLDETTPLVAVAHGMIGKILRGFYSGLDEAGSMALSNRQDAVYRFHRGQVDEIACAASED